LSSTLSAAAEQRTTLDQAAKDYVHLALEIGAHEKDFVDVYFGPPEWRGEAEAHPRNISELKAEADRILSTLSATDMSAQEPMEHRRNAWLRANVASARSRLDIIDDARFRFRDKAMRLFALAPELRPLESYDPVLERVEALVPGSGQLVSRARRSVSQSVRHSKQSTRRRHKCRNRRMPPPHARAHTIAGRRALQNRVCDAPQLGRLQLVSG
jgi:hypothetical protein